MSTSLGDFTMKKEKKEVRSKEEKIVFGGVEFTPKDFMEMTKESKGITDLLFLREAVASLAIEDELQTNKK